MVEVFRSERVFGSGVSCHVSKVAVEVEVATLTALVGGGEGGSAARWEAAAAAASGGWLNCYHPSLFF